MDQREKTGASHGKEGHGFGETIDRSAPLLIQEIKNGGDQRSGVTDTDPPDEIDDGEAPANGNVDAPNSDAFDDQPADGHVQHHHETDGQRESREPTDA